MSPAITRTRDEYAQRVEWLVEARAGYVKWRRKVEALEPHDIRIDDLRDAEDRARDEWEERLQEFLRFVQGEAEGRRGEALAG